MTFLTFLVWFLVAAVLFFLIVQFWEVLIVAGIVLYVIGNLIWWSFLSTMLWIIVISHTTEGWGWLWLTFLSIYSFIIAAYATVASNLIKVVGDYIFRRLK
jgi:hypothetical protein